MGTTTLNRAQESFYTALKQMSQAVTSIRNLRVQTEDRHQLEKSDLHGVTDQYTAVRASSKIRIPIAPGQTEFESTVKAIDQLLGLGSEMGAVVCMKNDCSKPSSADCSSIQSFWVRKGKQPPQILCYRGTLEEALATQPVAVLVNPDMLHDEHVPGYIRIDMSQPFMTLLIRGK